MDDRISPDYQAVLAQVSETWGDLCVVVMRLAALQAAERVDRLFANSRGQISKAATVAMLREFAEDPQAPMRQVFDA